MGGGDAGGCLNPNLVFSLSLSQAEQFPYSYIMAFEDTACAKTVLVTSGYIEYR